MYLEDVLPLERVTVDIVLLAAYLIDPVNFSNSIYGHTYYPGPHCCPSRVLPGQRSVDFQVCSQSR